MVSLSLASFHHNSSLNFKYIEIFFLSTGDLQSFLSYMQQQFNNTCCTEQSRIKKVKYILLNCLFNGNVVTASRLQSQESAVPYKDIPSL